VGKASLGDVRPSEVVGELRISLRDCHAQRWRDDLSAALL